MSEWGSGAGAISMMDRELLTYFWYSPTDDVDADGEIHLEVLTDGALGRRVKTHRLRAKHLRHLIKGLESIEQTVEKVKADVASRSIQNG